MEELQSNEGIKGSCLPPTAWTPVLTLSGSGRFQGEQERDFAHAEVEARLGHPWNRLANGWSCVQRVEFLPVRATPEVRWSTITQVTSPVPDREDHYWGTLTECLEGKWEVF